MIAIHVRYAQGKAMHWRTKRKGIQLNGREFMRSIISPERLILQGSSVWSFTFCNLLTKHRLGMPCTPCCKGASALVPNKEGCLGKVHTALLTSRLEKDTCCCILAAGPKIPPFSVLEDRAELTHYFTLKRRGKTPANILNFYNSIQRVNQLRLISIRACDITFVGVSR